LKLSQSQSAEAWLGQFQGSDSEIAAILLDELLLVGRDAFARSLYAELDEIAQKCPSSPMALFAEREMIRQNGDLQAYFSGTDTGRATGPGAPPIIAGPKTTEIGSEGPIANLITNYCRSNPSRALSHPGPDAMRQAKVSPVVLVTDFIGSGKRISEMLESLSMVATLQSWRSYHLIEFHVIAYSGTDFGIRTVSDSRLRPKIHIVTGCPTVYNSFASTLRAKVIDLCRRYPPGLRRHLGFQDTGSLIAFAHGMPNNCPPIFHSDHGGWNPMFPKRGTVLAEYQFPSGANKGIPDRVRRLLAIATARRKMDEGDSQLWVHTMLVLKALELGAKTPSTVSARTRLSLKDVITILGFTKIAGWVTEKNGLTKLGRLELQRLHRRRKASPVLPTDQIPLYYPTQLRAR
jgi:hypothetical protein